MKDEALYVALPSGQNFGWGVCGRYLKKELAKRVKCILPEGGTDSPVQLPGKLFTAIRNQNLLSNINAWGSETYGYTFFERNPTELSEKNAKNYQLVLCGSTWCAEKLHEAGILNTGILIQGIDSEIFYPVTEEKTNESFVIFSGGKFEFRKGQDLVLKAVKILQEKYSDIFLINAWYNIWPETMMSMKMSDQIKFELKGNTWKEMMNNLYVLNNLEPNRINTFASIPYEQQREIFKMTDLAVFPNRCEGGTNLVMMEYMACGKPVIASYTSGHKDILTDTNSIMLTGLKDLRYYDSTPKLTAEWQEPSVEELVDKIEYAYNNRKKIKEIGKQAGEHLKNFTWGHSAEQLLSLIN